MKYLTFTNGVQIPIFPSLVESPDYYAEEVVETPAYTPIQSFMQNAFFCCGAENGKFLNVDDIAGLSLTDLNGNTWTFTKLSDTSIKLRITDPDNYYSEYTMTSHGDYSNPKSGKVWYLSAYEDNGTLKVALGNYTNSIFINRRNGDNDPYMQMGYIEGYADNVLFYSYYDDIRSIKPISSATGDWGHVGTVLRNITKGNIFLNVSTFYLQYPSVPYTSVFNIYCEPWYSNAPRIWDLGNFVFTDSIKDGAEQNDPDPYEDSGPTGPGGGSGTLDDTSDAISIPSLPTLSAVDAGFVTLFNPSMAQLQSLSSYLWGSLFDLTTYKKIFADPMDCILGLSIVPVNVPSGAAQTVKVGNISTNVTMNTAASQYVEVNCGSIDVKEYWGAYLDYAPYTHSEIYLPYIGTHPIDIDDIMGKTVTVVYHIDILSGACAAFVKCGSSVLYEFIGQCSSSIPISGQDWTDVINGVLSVAGNIGTMVATGGASAPTQINNIASTAVNVMKPSIEKSGSMSGTGGMMAVQTPYLILTRPKQAVPSRQNSFMGYPSFITENLGSLSGYTEIESIHLQGIFATSEELSEIESLLKGGVIL